MGVKGDQMNFIFFIDNKKDYSKSIVQSIGLHDKLSIGNLMSENKSRSECLFERVEIIMIGEGELPGNVFPDEMYQWNENIQTVEDKLAIEICKT